MLTLTETAACEWSGSGVRVNAVAPGGIASSGFDTYSPEIQNRLFEYAERVPMQRFDSLAVEAGGNICVASLVFGGISVFSPANGLLESYEADEPYCTNIAFGGPDLRTAYITLSGYGRLVAADWPRPGLALNDPLTARG